MYRRIFVGMVCMVLLGTFLVPMVQADEWNKATKVTVDQPVQVPGTVLPAGTYVFTLPDPTDSTLVSIFNADGTQLITTVQGISDYRMDTPDKPILQFEERPCGQPEALKAWFYPGYNSGVEFVYPPAAE